MNSSRRTEGVKILFSGSEDKMNGGNGAFSKVSDDLFGGFNAREKLILSYENILRDGSLKKRQKLTGWKNEKRIAELPVDLMNAPVMESMQRFTGVGFEYLNFDGLSDGAKVTARRDVMIFSNLLGPILGGDMIPETKLKQGVKLGEFDSVKHYKKTMQKELENWVGDEDVLDLRAGVYGKMFDIPAGVRILVPRFLKDSKSVSHWSKAYRGEFLKYVLEAGCKSIEDMMKVAREKFEVVSEEWEEDILRVVLEVDF